MSHDEPFYGRPIVRREEQEYINKLLEKYTDEPATEGLKQKVYDELMWEKHMGRISIPFKVELRENSGHTYIEVVLESQV